MAFAMAHPFIDRHAAQGLIELRASFFRGEGEEYPVPQFPPPPPLPRSLVPPLPIQQISTSSSPSLRPSPGEGVRRFERVRPQVDDPWGSGEGFCIGLPESPEVKWSGKGEEEVGLEVLVGLKEEEMRVLKPEDR